MDNEVKDDKQIVADEFLNLGAKYLGTKEDKVLAFEGLLDAEERAEQVYKRSSSIVKANNLFFIINKIITEIERTIAEKYLSECYDIYGKGDKKLSQIEIVGETAWSKEKRERIEREEAEKKREEDNKKFKLLTDINRRTKADVGVDGTAIYLMKSELGVTISVSQNPEEDHKKLQAEHKSPLELKEIVWFLSQYDAMKVLSEVHVLLKLEGEHLYDDCFTSLVSRAERTLSNVIKEMIKGEEIDKILFENGFKPFYEVVAKWGSN